LILIIFFYNHIPLNFRRYKYQHLTIKSPRVNSVKLWLFCPIHLFIFGEKLAGEKGYSRLGWIFIS